MKPILNAVLAGALLWPAHAAAAEPIKFKIATIAPADSPWDDALKQFKEALTKRTGGALTAQLYMGGRLGSEAEMVKQVQFGSTECVGASTGSFSALVPGLDVFELPFLWDSPEQAVESLEKLRPYFGEQFEKRGLHLVGWSENGWRDFMTDGKPIKSVADLKGLKIRSQENPMHIAFWKALGAQPKPLPTTEFEKAMKSKLVQAGDNSVVLTAAFGWNNAIKSFTVSRHMYQPAVVVCNKAWFDKLPASERQHIGEGMAKIESEVRTNLNASEKEFLELFKSQGIAVEALSPEDRKAFAEATAGVRQKFAKGIPSQVIKVIEQVRGRKI